MKKFKVRIPRCVRMTEWETLVVNADNKELALTNAMSYENVLSSTFDTEDHEYVDTYEDEIEIKEIEND